MIRITRRAEFSAAHFYHNPNLSPEENQRLFGKCNNPHGHGHNYVLEVTVAGEPDPDTGMILDLKELKDILQTEVMDRMDHRHLNYEVAELAGQIPTCENIASVIWNLLEPKITKGKLDRVRLYESPDLFADCTEQVESKRSTVQDDQSSDVESNDRRIYRGAGQSANKGAKESVKEMAGGSKEARRTWRDR